MKIAESIRGQVSALKLSAARIALAFVLLSVSVSGCASVIRNSEAFYKDRPQRPINWNEYLMN